MPLYRRLPKRGFNNKNYAVKYVVLSVDRLNEFEDGSDVNLELVLSQNLVTVSKAVDGGLKVIGNAEITKKLNVKAKKFTASAKEAIVKAGGTAEEV